MSLSPAALAHAAALAESAPTASREGAARIGTLLRPTTEQEAA